MAEKRKREDGHESSKSTHKKLRTGFRVGPKLQDDSAYKRHNEKIKRSLIERAHIKKQYAKVKRQLATQEADRQRTIAPVTQDSELADVAGGPEGPAQALHPDRADLMNESYREDDEPKVESRKPYERRPKKPRSNAFARELIEAERRKAEAEARQAAREQAQRERLEKIAERERFRKAMAKARTADGQRKLGRESTVLLEKVKRMVNAK